MSLLVSGVFGDEVEVFPADDQSPMHFGGDDFASEDPAPDGDHAGEGAFLVCSISRINDSSLTRKPELG